MCNALAGIGRLELDVSDDGGDEHRDGLGCLLRGKKPLLLSKRQPKRGGKCC